MFFWKYELSPCEVHDCCIERNLCSSCCRTCSLWKSLEFEPATLPSSSHHTCIFCRRTGSVRRTCRPGPAGRPLPAEKQRQPIESHRVYTDYTWKHKEPGTLLNRKCTENEIKTVHIMHIVSFKLCCLVGSSKCLQLRLKLCWHFQWPLSAGTWWPSINVKTLSH